MKTVKIGFVGCGAISGIYLENITHLYRDIEVIGVCDLIPERAQAAVEKYNIPKLYADMYELFADPEVDIVLNITRPYQHYDVSMAALRAGKHVYSEKPLADTLERGREIVALAKEKGLLLGGAPDTFMGASHQTCRKLIENGYIGTPIGGAACMMGHGPESWHPDPDFFYKHAGGPLFDMGPYYITALVNMLGSVSDVYAMSKRGFDQRIATCKQHFGEVIDVEVDTFIQGALRFENGTQATLFTTFDVYHGRCGIEIYGTEGTLFVPDPNGFGGEIRLYRPEHEKSEIVPLSFPYKVNSRGLGLADMAKALTTGRPFRANCEQTLHVLEIMDGLLRSGKERREIAIESRMAPRAPMKTTNLPGVLED